jgi:hypothetical protein
MIQTRSITQSEVPPNIATILIKALADTLFEVANTFNQIVTAIQ